MSKPEEFPFRETDVIILAQILRNLRHRNEAFWIGQAFYSPANCYSPAARAALRRSITLARESGFPLIADWIAEVLLGL